MADASYAVLFDLDGVLIDSAEFHFASWRWLAERHDRSFSAAFFHETFGMPNRLILPRLFPERELSDTEMDELGELKERRYRELAAEHLDWAPGAERLVEGLRADARFAIGLYTSTPPSNLDFLDELLGLRRRMAAVISGKDVARGKPDPEGYVALAARLGVPPARSVVLEDAPAGIAAGRAAGALVVGLATTHPAARLHDADQVVPDAAALDPETLATWLADRARSG